MLLPVTLSDSDTCVVLLLWRTWFVQMTCFPSFQSIFSMTKPWRNKTRNSVCSKQTSILHVSDNNKQSFMCSQSQTVKSLLSSWARRLSYLYYMRKGCCHEALPFEIVTHNACGSFLISICFGTIVIQPKKYLWIYKPHIPWHRVIIYTTWFSLF